MFTIEMESGEIWISPTKLAVFEAFSLRKRVVPPFSDPATFHGEFSERARKYTVYARRFEDFLVYKMGPWVDAQELEFKMYRRW